MSDERERCPRCGTTECCQDAEQDFDFDSVLPNPAKIVKVMKCYTDEQLAALRADERKRMADQLRDGLEHLDRDGTYGTLVSPGDVAQLIAAVEAGN